MKQASNIPGPMIGRASFDRTGAYRYTLHRVWTPGAAVVCFCLLNPSTADAHVLDPTLTRCLGFAQRWGYGAMEVVNAFALRSTDPAGLRAHPAPVGPGNDRAIRRAVERANLIVVGWGTHASLADRGAQLSRAITRWSNAPVTCWGRTQGGHPRHPLYLAKDTGLIPYFFEG